MKKKISYKGFEISVNSYNSRFGIVYTATNDIGEDYMDLPAFKTSEQAIKWDKKNIDSYVKENK